MRGVVYLSQTTESSIVEGFFFYYYSNMFLSLFAFCVVEIKMFCNFVRQICCIIAAVGSGANFWF